MLNLRYIHSLTEFLRNHKEHVKRLRESKTPEVLTVNGKPELVIQSAECYQDMLDRLEYAESVAGLRRAYSQVHEGLARDLREEVAEVRSRHGL